MLAVTDVDIKCMKCPPVLHDREIAEVGADRKKSVTDRVLRRDVLLQVGRKDVVRIREASNDLFSFRLFALGIGGKRGNGSHGFSLLRLSAFGIWETENNIPVENVQESTFPRKKTASSPVLPVALLIPIQEQPSSECNGDWETWIWS